jgi:hypothetical protein
MDFFYWGGPVYCKQANELKWERKTKVFCNPQEGMSNQAYFLRLGKDPLNTLLRKAKLDPKEVQSIGFGGFSAYHQLINPMLKIPENCNRIDYVHLADACFMGPNPKKPKTGFACFAKRAVNGDCRMTATTNGPWGKPISYWGPKGSKYEGVFFNLSSGAQCFEQVWKAAAGDLVGDPEVPPGVPPPTRAYKKGELYWFHYEKGFGKAGNPHGGHVGILSTPYMQMYGVPWMAGHRGFLGGLDSSGLMVGGIFAALGYLGMNYYQDK